MVDGCRNDFLASLKEGIELMLALPPPFTQVIQAFSHDFGHGEWKHFEVQDTTGQRLLNRFSTRESYAARQQELTGPLVGLYRKFQRGKQGWGLLTFVDGC